jgi:hypothetical protein
MKPVVETVRVLLAVLAIGVVAGSGIRAAEWAIPKPETRVIVCMADDLDKIACKSLTDMLPAKAGKQ